MKNVFKVLWSDRDKGTWQAPAMVNVLLTAIVVILAIKL